MDFNKLCRTCLGTASLSDIFQNIDDPAAYSNNIYAVTGIQVKLNDGLPQKICSKCSLSLNISLKFRVLCHKSKTELEIIKMRQTNINIQINAIFVNEIVNIETKSDTLKPTIKYETVTPLINRFENEDISIEDRSKSNLFKIEKIDFKEELFDSVCVDEDDKPLKNYINKCSDGQNIDNNTTIKELKVKKQMKAYIEVPIVKLETLTSNGTELKESKITRVPCNLCSRDLSVRSLQAHMTRHHPGAVAQRVPCEMCDEKLLLEKMGRHVGMVHGTEFRCMYCKMKYDSKEVLIDHVPGCTAKKKKRKPRESARALSECDVCHKRMQHASIKLHKAIQHAGLGPVCEHCGRRFSNKFRLCEHYRAKHGYEKFKCANCEFQSASRMALRNHERRHRGEKPYVCETCGAKFHAAYLLAQHKQSHRTEKLAKCDLCPARFKANNSLHMHKITCHSSNLYKCTMCPRVYRCRHYAVKHLRHVHRFHGPVPRLQCMSHEMTQPVDKV